MSTPSVANPPKRFTAPQGYPIRPPVWAIVAPGDPSRITHYEDATGMVVTAADMAVALNAASDLRLALENVEGMLAAACTSPNAQEWELISDAWGYVKAILAGETLVETESETAAEILGLPWDDDDPDTEIEAAVSAMGRAEVFGEDGTP